MTHPVTLIRGDGTGPELAAVTRSVLDATGVAFEWHAVEAGVDVMEKKGTPLPDDVLASIKKTKTCIKAPITTPVGTGFRSVNVALRKEFDLYACVRPCKSYPGVRSRYEASTSSSSARTPRTCTRASSSNRGNRRPGSCSPTSPRSPTARPRSAPTRASRSSRSSIFGTERIVKAAFEYARKQGRKKVTAVHKSNIMKFTDGLFLATARKVAERYPDIAFEDRIVDNMCMQLVQKPEDYDVLVLPNLYGDVLSRSVRGFDRRPRHRAGDEPR